MPSPRVARVFYLFYLVRFMFLKPSQIRRSQFQEEVMSHSEGHRTIVRLAVESALQRYLWNTGMCGGGVALASNSGGVMEIGIGCFLARPGKFGIDLPDNVEEVEIVTDENMEVVDISGQEKTSRNPTPKDAADTIVRLAKEDTTLFLQKESRKKKAGGSINALETKAEISSDDPTIVGEEILEQENVIDRTLEAVEISGEGKASGHPPHKDTADAMSKIANEGDNFFLQKESREERDGIGINMVRKKSEGSLDDPVAVSEEIVKQEDVADETLEAVEISGEEKASRHPPHKDTADAIAKTTKKGGSFFLQKDSREERDRIDINAGETKSEGNVNDPVIMGEEIAKQKSVTDITSEVIEISSEEKTSRHPLHKNAAHLIASLAREGDAYFPQKESRKEGCGVGINSLETKSEGSLDDPAVVTEEVVDGLSGATGVQILNENGFPIDRKGRDSETDLAVDDAEEIDSKDGGLDVEETVKTHGQTSVLRALLRSMTIAAEASVILQSDEDETWRLCNSPVISAIILLDAPLLSSETSSVDSISKKTLSVSKLASDHRTHHDMDTAGNNQPAEPAKGSSNASSQDKVDNLNVQQTDDSAHISDHHPAGLGDPDKAIEAILSWIDEGYVYGNVRREVIIICGGDSSCSDITMNTLQERTSTRNDTSDGRGGLVGRPSKTKYCNIAEDKSRHGATDVTDVSIGQREGIKFNNMEDSRAICRSPLQQIVLGEMKPTTPLQIKVSNTRVGATEKIRESLEAKEKIIEKEDDQAIRASGTTSSIQSVQSTANPSQRLLSVHPSEVLIQTRVAPKGSGSRVTVTFPPPTGSSSAPASCPINIEFGESNRSKIAETEEPVQNLKSLLKVVVGPVIGRVGPTSAIVLVEVDLVGPMAAPMVLAQELANTNCVGVKLTDTLSGRNHEINGGVWVGDPGVGPQVFKFEKLTPGRRYSLKLRGVRPQDEVRRK